MTDSGSTDQPSDFDALPEPEAPAPSRGGRLAALWVGIAALLAAGVFGIAFLAADDEGSPEDAVRRLLRAVAEEDIIGVLETLPPSEREPLLDELPRVTEELKRLEILSGGFRLEEVRGVDLSFDDVQLQARRVGEGVSSVRLTGGKVSYRVDPKELQLGDFITDLGGIPEEVQSGSEDMVTGDEGQDEEDEIVTITEDGRWYVSLFYSIAEGARKSAGAKIPDFGADRDPKGESSPEKAVEALARAGLALDVARAIELVDPKEGRALHDYAPLFIESAKEEAAASDFRGDLKSIELSSKSSGGGRAVVTIEKFAFDFASSEESGSVAWDGECLNFSNFSDPEEDGELCPDSEDIPGPITDLYTSVPQGGIVAVQRDGEWFLSPTRTVFEGIVNFLKGVDRQDLEELGDFFGGTARGGVLRGRGGDHRRTRGRRRRRPHRRLLARAVRPAPARRAGAGLPARVPGARGGAVVPDEPGTEPAAPRPVATPWWRQRIVVFVGAFALLAIALAAIFLPRIIGDLTGATERPTGTWACSSAAASTRPTGCSAAMAGRSSISSSSGPSWRPRSVSSGACGATV